MLASAFIPESNKPRKITKEELITVLEIGRGQYDYSVCHPAIRRGYNKNMLSTDEAYYFQRNTLFQYTKASMLETIQQIVSQTESAEIDEVNTAELTDLVSSYFQAGNVSDHLRTYFAMVQLDGLLTGFTNFGRYYCDKPTPASILEFLAKLNLLPLPAAFAFFLKHLEALAHSPILIGTIANSSVESALLLLQHLPETILFVRDRRMKNSALELAVAKGRLHIESGGCSALPLGVIIDAMIASAKEKQIDFKLLFDNSEELPPAPVLAAMQGDLQTLRQLPLDLIDKPEQKETELSSDPVYHDCFMAINYYTSLGNAGIKERVVAEGDVYARYNTFSFYHEAEWTSKLAECKKLIQESGRAKQVSPRK